MYNGVALRSAGDPVLYLKNPTGVGRADRRTMLDALQQLNRHEFDRFGDPETQTRISQYEMAFRMQRSVPELTDYQPRIADHARYVRPKATTPGSFAAQRAVGTPAGRARRARRANSASRLGSASSACRRN